MVGLEWLNREECGGHKEGEGGAPGLSAKKQQEPGSLHSLALPYHTHGSQLVSEWPGFRAGSRVSLGEEAHSRNWPWPSGASAGGETEGSELALQNTDPGQTLGARGLMAAAPPPTARLLLRPLLKASPPYSPQANVAGKLKP